ncbi:MAG: DUF3800 domain-containing protein [Nitrospirae bacterium]|nr:DUF3800 domain-containing protein [Nitrospirota bacterium]MBI5696114.1 DUF3800 domain-containing protein [Nitrospirota bacterium]
MYLCYIDESGTPQIPGNTSHFILAGLSVPIEHWRTYEHQISAIKSRHDIDAEIHTGWIVRSYLEQSRVAGFDGMSKSQRIYEVKKLRNIELLRLQKSGNSKAYKQAKKTYRQTEPYIHLGYSERAAFLRDIAATVGNWNNARLFAECIDKIHFDPTRNLQTLDEQAFEQIVSRFEHYLSNINAGTQSRARYGLLIHDNNETVSKRHTELMKAYHKRGTFWRDVNHIIETPLFVNSELTSMVQIADICAYALRRYLENGEDELFSLVFKRADKIKQTVVGVRHFTNLSCACKICTAHRAP